MKVTMFAIAGAMTVVSATPVASLAQSTIGENSLPTNTSQSSNSLLEGINNRSAQNDFSQFFRVTGESQNNSENTDNRNGNVIPVTYQESIVLPDTPIILQPAKSDSSGNDGVQLQLNLQDLEGTNETQ